MIPNTATDVQVTSSLTGETGQFTVDENSLGKIMSVLTNLYSDPEGAVVREYLTNALDSQIEAQEKVPNYVWRPIDVTTPSHFQNEYKVRDYGIGMSVNDIKDIYSKYGKSTKESSNSVTGMLGLGSKCALTYTGQFTITGYKNGVRTRATVSINEDHIPEFAIVDTRATDEPNGVEIAVPVRDRNSFADKTTAFLKWWSPGQVLVNGSEPTAHGLTEVKPGIFLIEKNQQNYRHSAPVSYVIMGNVPYAVDEEYVDEHLRAAGLGFAAYVPMGQVDFPPNREKLMYNTRTKATVRNIGEGLFDAILTEKLKEITSAPDHRTAWRLKADMEHYFSNSKKARELKYKGLDFPVRITSQNMELHWDWNGHGQINERNYIDMRLAMAGTLIVTGVVQGTKPTSLFKKKVNHYRRVNGIEGTDAILLDADVDDVWLKWIPRISADAIKNIKLPKTPSQNAPRVEAPYDFYTVDSGGVVAVGAQVVVPVPAGKTLVHITPTDMKETYRKSGTTAMALAKKLGQEYILVVLGKNRFDKFLRSHNSIPVAVAIQRKINNYVKAITDEEYLVGILSHGEQQFLSAVNHGKVKDKQLAKLAKHVQDSTNANNYVLAKELDTYARRANVVVNLPDVRNAVNNPCARYPLISRIGNYDRTHMVIYVNAAWEELYAQP